VIPELKQVSKWHNCGGMQTRTVDLAGRFDGNKIKALGFHQFCIITFAAATNRNSITDCFCQSLEAYED
jgi:hypothetical protein